MKILGIDFESQCDQADTTNVTEVGAVLVEVDLEKPRHFSVLAQESVLVYEESYPPQTEEIVELTGITDAMLKAEGVVNAEALLRILPLVEQADIVMAHNTRFDKRVYLAWAKRVVEVLKTAGALANVARIEATYGKEWICTLIDVPYPKRFTCKKLGHLALEHGVPMDGRDLHRAVNDVLLMFELVLLRYDLKDILAYAREPWVYLRADILGPWVGKGGDGGIGKAQAGKLGYGWENIKNDDKVFPKMWVKRAKKSQVEKELVAPFRVVVL